MQTLNCLPLVTNEGVVGELLFPETDFGKRSEARNRLLADLLARTDFMEKAGTGIKRVKNACYDNGNEVNFYFNDAFWVTICSNINVVENVVENEVVILELLRKKNDSTAKELSNNLGISSRTVQRLLKSLIGKGIIKRIGPAKGGHWKVIKED